VCVCMCVCVCGTVCGTVCVCVKLEVKEKWNSSKTSESYLGALEFQECVRRAFGHDAQVALVTGSESLKRRFVVVIEWCGPFEEAFS
jgi:hypothetical protein